MTFLGLVTGHGHVVIPNSTRHGGTLATGGDCTKGQCYWFSNNIEIPGKETLRMDQRSVQLNVTGVADVYKTSPWRAPGTAKVFGSGCGVAGGSDTYYANGGWPPKGIKQGFDGVDLPKMEPVVWTRGSKVEVAWSISANHGGGYSYRLCKADGDISEECFQKTQLKFAGTTSAIIYADGTRNEFKMEKVTEGTYPEGSEWARDPVPGCYLCDAYTNCGAPLSPVPGPVKSKWNEQVTCCAMCDGAGASASTGRCPEGTETQFPEAYPGISGFGKHIWNWAISDYVMIPEDIEAGEYLLGWRWDCEESTQVWQNCADIIIK